MYEALYLHVAKRVYDKKIFNIDNYNSFLLGSAYSRKNNLEITSFKNLNSFDKGVVLHKFIFNYLENNPLPFEHFHCLITDLDYIREDVLDLYKLNLKGKEKTAFKNVAVLKSIPVPLMIVPIEIQQDYINFLDELIDSFKKITAWSFILKYLKFLKYLLVCLLIF